MSNDTNRLSPGAGEETFQLVWHNYQSNFHEVVGDLFSSEAFADVSLVAEGRLVRAHRLVLSACSPYLHGVLRALPPAPASHPILLMPPEVSLPTLRALLDFMYHGVVHVPHAALVAVLHAGDILQVRGLCRGDELQRPEQEQTPQNSPPPAASDTSQDRQAAPLPSFSRRRDKQRETADSVSESNASASIENPIQGVMESTAASELLGLIRIKDEPYDWTSEQHAEPMAADESVFRPTVLLSTKNENSSAAGETSDVRMADVSDDDEEPTPLTCEQCHEVFPRAASWVRHLKIHPPVLSVSRPLAPPGPPKQRSILPKPTPQEIIYNSLAALRKPHKCTQCGKQFSSRASLSIHGRTHTGETPFTCDLCHKGFNVKSNLLRHLRTLHNRMISPSDVDLSPT